MLLLSMCLLGACQDDFRPVTLVDNLRVLGMRADPAELSPGEAARLSALVVDPSRPGSSSSVLWIGCEPDPFNANRTACSDVGVVGSASSVAGLPPGTRIIGFNEAASYVAPADIFKALPVDDVRRKVGTTGQVLAIAIAEEVAPNATMSVLQEVLGRVQRGDTRSVVTLFRLPIAEGVQKNAHPTVPRLLVDGDPLPLGARLALRPNQALPLDVEIEPQDFESYVQVTPSGEDAKVERVVVAWYATRGELSQARTVLSESVKTTLTLTKPVAEEAAESERIGQLYVVLRDTRGGQSWQTFSTYACNPKGPTARVTSVKIPTSSGEPLLIEAENPEAVLDIALNGVALRALTLNPSTGRIEAQLAKGQLRTSGPTRVISKNCTRAVGPTATF
jgi:hypothetical protein